MTPKSVTPQEVGVTDIHFHNPKKALLKPFLINRVQGERTRTRKIDMELGNYLDRLGNQKGMITKWAQDKVNK